MSIVHILIFVVVLILTIFYLCVYVWNSGTLDNFSGHNLVNEQHPPDIKYSLLDRKNAEPNSAPFMVSLQKETPEGKAIHYCGGSILYPNWILIAAHCVEEIVKNNLHLVAGCNEINGNKYDECVQRRRIDKIFQHKLYVGKLSPYDIALIHIKTPFNFTNYVQSIKLNESKFSKNDAIFYGWGNMSRTAVPVYPNWLQVANMPIINCQPFVEGIDAYGDYIHKTNVCAGVLDGSNTICNGDSGGPLVQYDEKNEPFVVGIASWGDTPCGKVNAPSIFTDIFPFIGWIKNIISKYEQSI